MGCTQMTIEDSKTTVQMIDYGFGETAGVNTKFEDPCRPKNVVGLNESVYGEASLMGSDYWTYNKVEFKAEYDRPDGTHVKWYVVKSELGNGIIPLFGYSDIYQYIEGVYSNLVVTVTLL